MRPLDNLKIATPCPMKWSQMEGDDRVRHCAQCKLAVHNLSAMSEREAVELVTARKCVTFFVRADGTLITGDCRGGFSDHFWEKFATMNRSGVILLVGAAFTALFFATVLTLFGDNIRYLLSDQVTGLPGDIPVATRTVRPAKPKPTFPAP
jgi:hypothetical protein